ncbi:hypothetical protein ABIE44_001108 [Marmoricola sp. OAE513]|uniref:hypothetical protein n=1 Tax=Marmoricola sp. OAE513 TaxID=2817894 RepID=UPI001AE3EC9F
MTPAPNTPHRPEDDLSTTLARQADRFAQRGNPLELEQVIARAGEIRRGRRMRASIVMAAVVLAVAVPVGITTLSNNDPSGSKPPSFTQERRDQSPLALGDLKVGKAPKTGYVVDGAWKGPAGDLTLGTADDAPVAVAVLDGGLLVASPTLDGPLKASFIDESGKTVNTWPMDGYSFAVSADGNVGAFMAPDGIPMVVQDAGSRSYELPKIASGGDSLDVAAVVGDNCSGRGEDALCTVTVNSSGEEPKVWLSTRYGKAEQIDGPYRKLVAADPNTGYTAGITELKDDLSTCSAVHDNSFQDDQLIGKELWSTCQYRLLSFSPDGKYVLGTGSVGSGNGDSSLTVLEADTGKVVLDLDAADNAVIPGVVWEDSTHLLVNLLDTGRAGIERVSVKGTREYAVPPVTVPDATISAFKLPVLGAAR